MAAVNAVFNTVELLEAIILCAPAPPLSRLELVSSHWKAIIRSSPRIQQFYRSRILSPEGYHLKVPIYAKHSNLDFRWILHTACTRTLLRSSSPSRRAVRPLTIEYSASLNAISPYRWPDGHEWIECADFVTEPACQVLRIFWHDSFGG